MTRNQSSGTSFKYMRIRDWQKQMSNSNQHREKRRAKRDAEKVTGSPEQAEQSSKSLAFWNRRLGVVLVLNDPRHDRQFVQPNPSRLSNQLIEHEEKNVDDGRGIGGKHVLYREMARNEDLEPASDEDEERAE